MARGVNKVILVGNVGNDPECRFMPNGNPVANLSMATSESWTDKQSGQRQERVEWHKLVVFNKLAEIVQQYVKKGAKLYVEGKLQTRKWQDQNGQDRYSTEIVVNDMQMLDGRQDGQQQGQRQQPNQYQQQSQGGQGYMNHQAQHAQNQGQGGFGAPAGGNFDDFPDDQIPF